MIGQITDEYMMEMRKKTKSYTFVILHKTPKASEAGVTKSFGARPKKSFNHQRWRVTYFPPFLSEKIV